MPSPGVKEEAKRRSKKKKEGPVRIWLCGSRKWKDKRLVKKVLKQFDYQKVDFVLLGTSPGLEQLALSICRQLKFNCVILPPNITRDGIDAVYYRNYSAFNWLKPTHVFAFHDNLAETMKEDKKMLSETKSTIQLLKLAREKKIEHATISSKPSKEEE